MDLENQCTVNWDVSDFCVLSVQNTEISNFVFYAFSKWIPYVDQEVFSCKNILWLPRPTENKLHEIVLITNIFYYENWFGVSSAEQ